MISISFETLLSIFPVMVALFWPFVASFCGSETVLRQSLTICLYFIVCDQMLKWFRQLFTFEFKLFESFLNIIVLIFLFSQSMIRVPTIFINIFGVLLTNCEPIIVFIEVRQLIGLITRFGQYLADCVNTATDSEDNKSLIYKTIVLTITTISYSLGLFIIRSALMNAQTLLFTYAAILLVVFTIFQIIATIYVEDGIISDPGLIFLFSSLALYLSVFDDNNRSNISNIFNENEWLETQMSFNGKSLIYQLLSLPDVSTAYANEGLRWAKQHYGLGFWLALIIRITCILTWLIDHYDHYDYHSYDDQSWEQWSEHWLAQYLSLISIETLIKVMTTLIYTEMLLQQLPVGDSWPALGQQAFQSLLRLIQCFSLGIYYFYCLYVQTCDYD